MERNATRPWALILPVKRHPCARRNPTRPFSKNGSFEVTFGAALLEQTGLLKSDSLQSRMGAKCNQHTLADPPRYLQSLGRPARGTADLYAVMYTSFLFFKNKYG